MASSRPRVECPYCHWMVRDLKAHQRRSWRCRIYQAVHAIREQGYRLLNLPEPKLACASTGWVGDLESVPWVGSDGRIVILSGPSGVHYPRGHVGAVRSVWVHESVASWNLPNALSRALAKRVREAGGWIPYRRAHPQKPYPGPEHDMAVILWEWARSGDIEDQCRRYDDGPLYEEVPDYVHDRRVICDRCEAKVLKRSLVYHQQTNRCVATWMQRRKMVYVLALQASRDDTDPDWPQASAAQIVQALVAQGIAAEVHRLRVDYEGRPRPFVPSYESLGGHAYVVWVPADHETWANSVLKAAGLGPVLITAPWKAKEVCAKLSQPELFWMAVGESLGSSR